MLNEEIHSLVRSLSSKEKGNFSRYVGFNHQSKKKPDYYLLFERLQSSRGNDEAWVREPPQLKSPQRFFTAKRNLGVKIIQSLVHSSATKDQGIEFILIAIERNVISLAKKSLIEKAKVAASQTDTQLLQYLHHLRTSLQDSYGIKICFPDSIPTIYEIDERIDQIREAKDVLDEIIGESKKFRDREPLLLMTFSKRLQIIQLSTGLGGYYLKKSEMLIGFLDKGANVACGLMERLVEYLEENDFPFREGYFLQELSRWINLASHCGHYDTARWAIMKMAALKLKSSALEERRQKLLGLNYLLIAISQGNIDFANIGYEMLHSHRSSFEEYEVVLLTLGYAITKFVFAEYSECLYALRKIESLNKAIWGEIEFILQLLKILSYWEKEEYDTIEIMLPTLSRLAKSSADCMSGVLYNLIRDIYSKPERSFQSNWNSNEADIDACHAKAGKGGHLEIFDLRLWAKSKIEGVPLHEIYYQDVTTSRLSFFSFA